MLPFVFFSAISGHPSKCAAVDVVVDGHRCKALCDTGANISPRLSENSL